MGFAISQPKMVLLLRNKKQTYRLNFRPQMWLSGLTLSMTMTLNFQGQIWNLLYLSQRWSDCHEMKSKLIDWILDLKCDQWVWPWTWPWPWIFKVKCDFHLWPHVWPWPCILMVKFWNSCISRMGRPIDIEQRVWELAIHDHNHDLLWTKSRFKDLLDSDQGYFRCWHGVDSSSCGLVMPYGNMDLGQHWFR